MEEKTKRALQWIVNIFNKSNIPYRIGGGFAAHVYGSGREVNDIDISLSGEYFPVIITEVSPYITAGPKHYSNAKWDCDTLSLNYFGQEIDMTDVDTLRMSNKEQTEWFQTKDRYRKFPSVLKIVDGIEVSLIDPRDLVEYKKELADKDHEYQLIDVKAVEKYIAENGLKV
jgi:hypothetical protein